MQRETFGAPYYYSDRIRAEEGREETGLVVWGMKSRASVLLVFSSWSSSPASCQTQTNSLCEFLSWVFPLTNQLVSFRGMFGSLVICLTQFFTKLFSMRLWSFQAPRLFDPTANYACIIPTWCYPFLQFSSKCHTWQCSELFFISSLFQVLQI